LFTKYKKLAARRIFLILRADISYKVKKEFD